MQTLKNILHGLFDKWWLLLLLYLIVTLFVLARSMGGYQSSLAIAVTNYTAYSAVFILFCSMLWQFSQKRILVGLLHIVWFGGSFVGLLVVSFLNMFAPDHWADDLKLPVGVILAEPISPNYPDTINYAYTGDTTDLLLYDDMQPGMYTYQFCTPRCNKGTIYLAAYEITRGDFLSPSMATKTMCSVNETDTMMCFRPNGRFTIYEGDWEKYYGARFEVWFRPVNGGKDEKLFEKNFKVQGWMH